MVFDEPAVGLSALHGDQRTVGMLKIQRVEEGERVRLMLSGRIDVTQVAALRQLIDEERRHGAIVVDLKEVWLVDRDTVMFLVRCESSGVTLENASAYVCEWIARESAATRCR